MTSVHDGSFALDRVLIDRLRQGLPARIAQVGSVLAEDDVTIVSYVYFENCPDHDCIIISYDWTGRPQDFDRHRAAEQLLCDTCAAVH